MANRGFDFSDLVPSGSREFTFSASGRTDGLLEIVPRQIPAGQIRDKFKRAIDRASVRIAQDLKRALDAAVEFDGWNGGDLVDTGELMDSGSVIVNENGITIAYDAPYAALIHYGGYIHPYGNVNLRIYLPPRPWIESVLFGGGPVTQFDFVTYYTEEISKEFR